MMGHMLTPNDIDNLASLARLGLSEEEKGSLLKEMGDILGYIGEIQKRSGDSKKEEKAVEVSTVRNVFREDKNPHLSGEYTEVLIQSAPRRQDDFVKVKKIL